MDEVAEETSRLLVSCDERCFPGALRSQAFSSPDNPIFNIGLFKKSKLFDSWSGCVSRWSTGFKAGCQKRRVCSRREEQGSNETSTLEEIWWTPHSPVKQNFEVTTCIGQNVFASLPDTNNFVLLTNLLQINISMSKAGALVITTPSVLRNPQHQMALRWLVR